MYCYKCWYLIFIEFCAFVYFFRVWGEFYYRGDGGFWGYGWGGGKGGGEGFVFIY